MLIRESERLYRRKRWSGVVVVRCGRRSRWPRPGRVFAWMAPLVLLPVAASAACTPPADLAARVQQRASAENYQALGSWYSDHQQFACAAKAFASASAIEPDSSSLAYLWGLSLSSAGDDSAALIPLRHAAALDASDIRPHLAAAAALDKLHRTADAEGEWRKALEIDASSTTALDSLAQDLIEQKDYASVVALLEKPQAAGTLSPAQIVDLGIGFAATARLDDAAKVLRDGLNTAPDSIEIADELGVVLMLMARDQEAYDVLQMAIQKHPDNQPTQVLYLRILVTSHSDQATAYAKQLMGKYPRQWEVLYLNGLLAARDGDYARARGDFDESIALRGNYGPSRTALGNALTHLGDLHGAKEQIERGIALGDDSPDVEYSLATVERSLGETEGAAQTLRRYQQLKNAQSDRVQAAGKAESGDQSMAAGNFSQAAALYRDALSTDPDEAILHYKLSRALDKMNDTAGETTELERAIELNPKLAEAQNQLGYLIVRNGDAARAETFFRAATQVEPSYVTAWVNLAATLASEEKWNDARQAVSRALEIDPDNAQARGIEKMIAETHPQP